MVKLGKKHQKALQTFNRKELLDSKSALSKVKELAYAGFDESIDLDISLGIDPTKGDQVVRGSVVLPHGNGRTVKVAVFAKGDQAEAAKQAGADFVGAEDLIEKISGGWIDFDYTVATPDMMAAVGKLARVLGPKGLLPNKKLGTVALEVAPVVADLKKGKSFFKNDKQGLVHFSLGKVSFDADKLQENFESFMQALKSSKPVASKGKFVRKVTVSSSMGVGIGINLD